MNNRTRNLTGERFERLIVVELRKPDERKRRRMWLCRCDCGAEHSASTADLLSGHTRSCGCLKAEVVRVCNLRHGHTANGKATSEYDAWNGMWKRCTDPGNKHYKKTTAVVELSCAIAGRLSMISSRTWDGSHRHRCLSTESTTTKAMSLAIAGGRQRCSSNQTSVHDETLVTAGRKHEDR